MSLPRGWASKIGLALKIGVVVTATASDAGEVAGLPIPSSAAITAWAEDNGRGLSSAEKQGDMVNAAFDGLATAVADKSNELIDSAFMDAELEVGLSSINTTSRHVSRKIETHASARNIPWCVVRRELVGKAKDGGFTLRGVRNTFERPC